MNKIKFFSEPSYSDLKTDVINWVEKEKPTIISVSLNYSSSNYKLVVAYDNKDNSITL